MKRILNKVVNSATGLNKAGVIYYDGSGWYGVVYINHEYFHWSGSEKNEEVPESLLDWFAEYGVRHVRLLLSSELQLLDFVLPDKMSYEELSLLLSNELSIITGEDSAGIICTAVSSLTLGMKDNYLLVGSFAKSKIEEYRRAVESKGFVFGGVGCLELSYFAYCSNKYNINYDSFIVFGESHSFVLPGNQHLKKVGPMSLPGGSRNAELDYSSWLMKVEKRLRSLNECSSVYTLAFPEEVNAVKMGLEEVLADDSVCFVDYADIREKLAHLSVHTKVNSFSSPLNIVNDKMPRKLFSNAFILFPVLLILSVPFAFWGAAEINFAKKVKVIDNEIGIHIPLEKALAKAKEKRRKTQTRIAGLRKEEQALLGRRKPLNAFIHMAYFFSKYGGNIVKLNYLADDGENLLRIKGFYIDPERRLEMKRFLDAFVKEKKLKIIKDDFSGELDANGKYVLTLDMTIDYKDLKND